MTFEDGFAYPSLQGEGWTTRLVGVRDVGSTRTGQIGVLGRAGRQEPARALLAKRLESGEFLSEAGTAIIYVWDPLRNEPRFRELIRRLALPSARAGSREHVFFR